MRNSHIISKILLNLFIHSITVLFEFQIVIIQTTNKLQISFLRKLKFTLTFSGKNTYSFIKQRAAAPRKNGLLISFYVFLPFLILTAVIALKWNKIKRSWKREETVSEG